MSDSDRLARIIAARVPGREGFVAISLYDAAAIMEWADSGYEIVETTRHEAVEGFNLYAKQGYHDD